MKNKALVNARKDKGWTQEQLAEIVGVTQSMIAHLESGSKNPSKDNMERLSEALGKSVENLFFYT